METGRHLLEQLRLWAHDLPLVISALPWYQTLAVAIGPVVLSAFSRSIPSVCGAGLLVLLSALALSQAEAGGLASIFALAAYFGSIVVALHGLHERRRYETVAELGGELDALRHDIRSFLNALDRRAKAVDELALEASRVPKE